MNFWDQSCNQGNCFLISVALWPLTSLFGNGNTKDKVEIAVMVPSEFWISKLLGKLDQIQMRRRLEENYLLGKERCLFIWSPTSLLSGVVLSQQLFPALALSRPGLEAVGLCPWSPRWASLPKGRLRFAATHHSIPRRVSRALLHSSVQCKSW